MLTNEQIDEIATKLEDVTFQSVLEASDDPMLAARTGAAVNQTLLTFLSKPKVGGFIPGSGTPKKYPYGVATRLGAIVVTELYQEVQQAAIDGNISMNALLNSILREWSNKRKDKRRAA